MTDFVAFNGIVLMIWKNTEIFVAYFTILSQHLEDMVKDTRSSRTKRFSGYP
jgi:hypothetical protein